jgi:hypothetical protein
MSVLLLEVVWLVLLVPTLSLKRMSIELFPKGSSSLTKGSCTAAGVTWEVGAAVGPYVGVLVSNSRSGAAERGGCSGVIGV